MAWNGRIHRCLMLHGSLAENTERLRFSLARKNLKWGFSTTQSEISRPHTVGLPDHTQWDFSTTHSGLSRNTFLDPQNVVDVL